MGEKQPRVEPQARGRRGREPRAERGHHSAFRIQFPVFSALVTMEREF